MRRLTRSLVSWAIGFLPARRRTWSEAALAELDEAVALAWSFFALVAVVAMLAFTNARPVATVFRDYERIELARGYTAPPEFARHGFTARDVLRHHAEERRFNGPVFALLVAFVFAVALTRRRVRRT